MKKVILLFLFILIAPFASAIVSVEGPERTKYNKGDEVFISGYVFREEATIGTLLFTLICDNATSKALSIPLRLEKGEKKLFPGNLILPKIVAPQNMEGTCFINLALVSNDIVIEEDQSNLFTITTYLDGSFQIDKTQVQVGGTFTLMGAIFKLNGQDIDGSVELYLDSGNSTYLIDVIDITDGKFEYVYTTIPSIPGKYSIDLKVKDIYGNYKLFEDVASFILVDELYVTVKPTPINVLPEGKITIAGEAKTILLENLEGATVKIKLENYIYTTQLTDSKFSQEIILPKGIKSGKHTVSVTVNDDAGNWGNTETAIYVEAIPTKLVLEFGEKILRPGENIDITPYVYDQANDQYLDDVNIEIKDTKGNMIFSDIIKTAEQFIFQLPLASLPGSWSITGYAAGLSTNENVDVEQLLAADVLLVNQTLYIKNVGNVNYKKPVKMDFNNGEYSLIKRISLAPNEISGFYLYEEVPSGQYNIKVFYGDETKEFNDVTIVGKAKKSFNSLYWLLVVALIAIFAYLFISFRHSKPVRVTKKEKPVPISKAVMKKAEEIKKEENIKDFRNRILKDIKRVEEQQKEAEFKERILKDIKKTEEEQPKKGLFNMFG